MISVHISVPGQSTRHGSYRITETVRGNREKERDWEMLTLKGPLLVKQKITHFRQQVMTGVTNFTVCLWMSESYRKNMAKKAPHLALPLSFYFKLYNPFCNIGCWSWNTTCYKAILIEHTKCLFSESVKDFLLDWQSKIFSQRSLGRKIYILR